MKYLLLLPDGAADEPCPALDGQTPLEAAKTPHLDWLAQNGLCGITRTAPAGMYPGSDTCTMSLLGYEPEKFYTGRAPIEAAAQRLPVGPQDVVVRCNLVEISDGVMVDFSAGHIKTPEGVELIAALNAALQDANTQFYPGKSYRHLLVERSGQTLTFAATPPHDIQGQKVDKYLPHGPGAERMLALMEASKAVFAAHEVNAIRRDLGEGLATQIWLWGQGKLPALPKFADRFRSIRGACITEVDLIRGLANLIGWDMLEVDGLTGFTDTNYAGMGAAAVAALDQYDLVCVHVEAADECGHVGDAVEKTKAITNIDKHIIGPALAKLRTFPEWRVLLAPDHPTPCRLRTHSNDWPVFVLAGTGIKHRGAKRMTEALARDTGVEIDPASDLMRRMVGP